LVSEYLFHLNCFNLISWCYIIHLKGGEKIKIGRQNNSEKKTPAWRWKDRFHRDNPPFGGYAAYVSRPTFEDLRCSGKEGRRVFNAICKLLEMHENDDKNLEGRYDEEDGVHSFAILFPEEEINCIAVMIGPFDVSDEMEICKRGILFHVILCGNGDDDDVLPEMSKLSQHPKDIFNLVMPFETKLDSDLAPSEAKRTKWFETVLEGENSKGYSFYKFLNMDALDLSAARLLPSDVFIRYSRDKEINGFEYCRRFMTRQFNEVRLLGDIGKPNIEQTNTMNAYEFNKSSIMNINGRPGTGKSTILHMLTCESLLQLGPNIGKRRVLYLATTDELITEAKEEIKNLLEHLYLLHNTKNLEEKLDVLLAGIDFATEEGFFLTAPGTLGPLDDAGAFKECIKKAVYHDDWAYWKDEKNYSLLQRILRNFVYGVFGSPSAFCKWLPNHRDVDAIHELFKRPFNFFAPGERYIPDEDDLLSSDITPLYFWNPHFDDDPEVAAKRVGGLALFLEMEGGLGDYLIDYSIGKTTGLWDPSGVIHGTATKMYEADEEMDLTYAPLWHQMQTKGYDSIFIDESQDFSARTIATLLQYFSNRGAQRGVNHLPFTFVCAGDEFQTIYGTLFQGAMIHINKIFTDWKLFLLNQSTGEMRSFAYGLPNPVKISLRASYRTFDTAVKVIDNVVKDMREITLKENHRRTVGASKIGYTRTGVLAGLRASGRGRGHWDTALGHLCEQLEETLEREVVQTGVKVALIFPEQRIRKKAKFCKLLEDFSNLEHAEPFKEKIGAMITLINEKYDTECLSDGEDAANEKVVSMIKEAGFYDIAAIKGQTHVAVVALKPPINPDKDKRWFDKLLDLSLSLVMVSRSQIGLFIAATDSNTKKIVGDTIWESDSYNKNQYYSSISEASDFSTRLRNSAAPVISPEKLFAYALEEWYNPRAWERLRKSDVLRADAREFIGEIKQIFQAVRNKQPKVQSDFSVLEDLFEDPKRKRNIISVLGSEAFFEEDAIHKLRHFLHWQMISRELLEFDDGYGVQTHVKELEKYWSNVSDVDNHTNNWMDLIFDEDNSAVELLIGDPAHAPWELDRDSITPIPFQNECHVPRLKIGPWKFTAPPEAKFLASWVSENQHWSPSVKVLRTVIRHTLKGEKNSKKRRRMFWVLDHISQDGEAMVETSLQHNMSGDSSTIRWIIRTTINTGGRNTNVGLWFYEQLRIALKKKLDTKDPSLLSAISNWLTGLDDAWDIVKGLEYVADLVIDGAKQSRKPVNEIYANLDPSVLTKWLRLVNVDDLDSIPREIIALGGERCLNMFTQLNNLMVASNVKETLEFDDNIDVKGNNTGDFATSLFKIKIGTVRTEFQAPLKGGLEDFIIAIFTKLLTDLTVPFGGHMRLGDIRKEEIFNRFKKFDVRECPRGDSGKMKKIRGGVPRRECDTCGMIRKEGEDDESVEWFRDFNDTTVGWSGNLPLIVLIQEVIRSARDNRFEYLMDKIRTGKIPFHAQFQTRDAEVIAVGSSHSWPYWEHGGDSAELWRYRGHLFDWSKIQVKVRGIDETATARFIKNKSKHAIALNGKTFDGYMAVYRGDDELASNSFFRGGAIPETQVMLLKSIQLGGGVDELLNGFCDAMMVEASIYLAHVNKNIHNSGFAGRDWKVLPGTIWDVSKSEIERDWPAVWEREIDPYINQMNQYFELHAFLEKIKLFYEKNEEFLSAPGACVSEGLEVAVYKSDAFKNKLPKINKGKATMSSTRNERETIICSSTPSNEKRRTKIINDFALLLSGYRRASEENDFTIYLDAIFRVISAPGLQRVFDESLEEGYELDDSSKKIDARYILLQYLESLELFTPTLIEGILQQLEQGKPEDGLFNGADEEIREAYGLFCSNAFQEEEK